ncbi:hypothetical protein Plhal304r1_c009g0036861 [Plasmopara halstedii]
MINRCPFMSATVCDERDVRLSSATLSTLVTYMEPAGLTEDWLMVGNASLSKNDFAVCFLSKICAGLGLRQSLSPALSGSVSAALPSIYRSDKGR